MTAQDRDLIFGFNAVEGALAAGGRVTTIWILAGKDRPRARRLADRARAAGARVEQVDARTLDRVAGGATRDRHQGIVARVTALRPADPAALVASCGPVARILIADGVEDPRNLGALIRTAAAAGADGVVLPDRRSASPGATVAKVAAGALDRVPVARVGNVVPFLKSLKKNDFWVIGLAGDGDRTWDAIEYPSRMALVVGGEGRGLRRLVRETCDQTVAIPLSRGVESLNVSVAAGICLYEALRQGRLRGGAPGPGGRKEPEAFT